jgi:hypothetical protein
VLGEGRLSVEVEVEASSSSAATNDPDAAASAARGSSVGVGIAIVGGRHNCGSGVDVSRGFEFVYSLSRRAM